MTSFAGHISHVFENLSLSFGDIKEIITMAAQGTLQEVVEKIDGINIIFSFGMNSNELVVARNKTELLSGGINREELSNKYINKEILHEAFLNGYDMLYKCIITIPEAQRNFIFANKSLWYSAEIVYVPAKNVISYDSNCIVFHGSPAYQIVNDKIHKHQKLPSFGTLETFISKMQSAIAEREWKVHGPIMARLQQLSDGTILNKAIDSINELMAQNQISNNDTILNYLIQNLIKNELSDFELNDFDTRIKIAKRLIGIVGSPSVKELRKEIPTVQHYILNYLIKEQKEIIENYMLPLENIIQEFAIEILRGLKSTLISDTDKEIQRLQNELKSVIADIKALKNPKEISMMNKILPKIGNIEKLYVPCEGIIFLYKGQTYKFSGQFKNLNALCGLIKYGRKIIDPSALDQ